jgi:hypothetical protein
VINVRSLPEKRLAGEAAVATVVNVPRKKKEKVKFKRKISQTRKKKTTLDRSNQKGINLT